MTTTIEKTAPAPAVNERQLAGLQRWAGRELVVDVLEPDATLRQQAMQQLADDDFIPPLRKHYAWQILGVLPGEGAATSLPSEVLGCLNEEESRLRAEVETFATTFFNSPPFARRERWRLLSEQAAPFPAVFWRLSQLEAGLDTDTPSFEAGSLEEQLAERLRTLFVLPHPLKGPVRRLFFASCRDQAKDWTKAAARLAHAAPQMAALDPPTITRLQSSRLRAKAPDEVSTTPVPASNSDSTWSRGMGWIIAVIFIGAIKACTMSSSSRSTDRPYLTPKKASDLNERFQNYKPQRRKVDIPEPLGGFRVPLEPSGRSVPRQPLPTTPLTAPPGPEVSSQEDEAAITAEVDRLIADRIRQRNESRNPPSTAPPGIPQRGATPKAAP